MNFWVSLEYAVGVMIGSCSVIGVVGAKYRNHYAQIVMVGISVFQSVLPKVVIVLSVADIDNAPYHCANVAVFKRLFTLLKYTIRRLSQFSYGLIRPR